MSHFYEYKSFSPEQDVLLRSSVGPSFYQHNFLSQEEFEFCRKIVMSVTDWPEIGRVSKYWGFGLNDEPGKQLGWLLEKIKKIVPNLELDFFAIQEAINPWKIHADIRYRESSIPYKVILLPMDVEPISGPVDYSCWPDTFTIAFNQRNFLKDHESLKTIKNQSGIYGNTGQDHWKRPADNPQVENINPGYHIDQETYKKYFTHLPYDHLEGLTIDAIHHWVPRSVFYWDNVSLHCADDFLSKSIKTKRSLMIFSNYQS